MDTQNKRRAAMACPDRAGRLGRAAERDLLAATEVPTRMPVGQNHGCPLVHLLRPASPDLRSDLTVVAGSGVRRSRVGCRRAAAGVCRSPAFRCPLSGMRKQSGALCNLKRQNSLASGLEARFAVDKRTNIKFAATDTVAIKG